MDQFKFLPFINIDNKDSALQYFSKTNETEAFHTILTRKANLERITTIVEKFPNNPNAVLKELFSIADEYLNLTTQAEMLSLVLYVGLNMEAIMNSARDIVEREKSRRKGGPKDLPDIIKGILGNLGAGAKMINMATGEEWGGTPKLKKSKYTYKLDTRLFIEDVGGDDYMTVTNNIENVLNEIILKEGFPNIEPKRVFAKGTDEIISEIKPRYKNQKCVSATFETIS